MSESKAQAGESVGRWPDGKLKVVEIHGGAVYLDAHWPHGVKVEAKNADGWLTVDIAADEGIKGYAITFNGRELPG